MIRLMVATLAVATLATLLGAAAAQPLARLPQPGCP
jgi:ABC-type phosphate/phosphonate transport system permease subunit